MASQSESKRRQLQSFLIESRISFIDETAFQRIREALTPISESYLRKLVKETCVPLSPVVEGVRQETRADLERTLLALGAEYEMADPERRRRVRAEVITAKDHARWALKKGRAEKEEMLLWMLTWLENPPLFREWLAIRKRVEPPA